MGKHTPMTLIPNVMKHDTKSVSKLIYTVTHDDCFWLADAAFLNAIR
jgi:hypothetical protein